MTHIQINNPAPNYYTHTDPAVTGTFILVTRNDRHSLLNIATGEYQCYRYTQDDLDDMLEHFKIIDDATISVVFDQPREEPKPSQIRVQLNENHQAIVYADGVEIDGHTFDFELFEQIQEAVVKQRESTTT